MAHPSTKQILRQLIDELPDDATIADVQYRLYIIGAVNHGRDEIAAGGGIPHAQVAAELRAKWCAARIDYRHVIWPLVTKPGAFARYRYREELWGAHGPRHAGDAAARLRTSGASSSAGARSFGFGGMSRPPTA